MPLELCIAGMRVVGVAVSMGNAAAQKLPYLPMKSVEGGGYNVWPRCMKPLWDKESFWRGKGLDCVFTQVYVARAEGNRIIFRPHGGFSLVF